MLRREARAGSVAREIRSVSATALTMRGKVTTVNAALAGGQLRA
jgi:hypothetical protein